MVRIEVTPDKDDGLDYYGNKLIMELNDHHSNIWEYGAFFRAFLRAISFNEENIDKVMPSENLYSNPDGN